MRCQVFFKESYIRAEITIIIIYKRKQSHTLVLVVPTVQYAKLYFSPSTTLNPVFSTITGVQLIWEVNAWQLTQYRVTEYQLPLVVLPSLKSLPFWRDSLIQYSKLYRMCLPVCNRTIILMKPAWSVPISRIA